MRSCFRLQASLYFVLQLGVNSPVLADALAGIIQLFSRVSFSCSHLGHLLREMQKVDAGSAFFYFATLFSSLQVHRLNQKGSCCVCWYFYHESRVRKYQWCNDVWIFKLVGEKRRFRSRASYIYVPYSGFCDWLCDWTSPIFLPGSSISQSVLMRASSSSMTYSQKFAPLAHHPTNGLEFLGYSFNIFASLPAMWCSLHLCQDLY